MQPSSESLVEAVKARDMNLLTPASGLDYGLKSRYRKEIFALYVVAINDRGVTATDLHDAFLSSEDSSGLRKLLEERAAGPELDRVHQLGGIRTIKD